MEPQDIVVGMKVRCGLHDERTGEVVGVTSNGVVRVKYMTGETVEAFSWMLRPLKRPSARYSLIDIVREFERKGGTVDVREQIDELVRKLGVQ
jgi:hypothetical protein